MNGFRTTNLGAAADFHPLNVAFGFILFISSPLASPFKGKGRKAFVRKNERPT
jgi:hypothetical protein